MKTEEKKEQKKRQKTEKYICIHGHFYQPIRVNPWIEEIDIEPSSAPYHNWNEKIFKECYEANLYSRILDSEGKIQYILNNFRSISFNFGATLLRWLEEKEPKSYEKILWADRQSQKERSGHGNALAQSYHHSILPLLERKEKQTEIFWGIQDFRLRFGRDPEGIWLPETAVDHETLEVVADHGIRFVILAPHQAKRVRKTTWVDCSEESINPRQPYSYSISGNQSLTLFFYDSMLSHTVAFDNLLQDGKKFSKKLQSAFESDSKKEETKSQLVHIATDGESYGHHSKFGEMALSYALYDLSKYSDCQLTNYGEFLDRQPPIHEVEIREKTSWSCPHDLGRWKSNCGCNFKKGWNQKWRDPLRLALLELKSNLDFFFEQEAPAFFWDIWNARNDYIEVIFVQNKEPHLKNKSIEHFFSKHGKEHEINNGTKIEKGTEKRTNGKNWHNPIKTYLENQNDDPTHEKNGSSFYGMFYASHSALKLLEMQRESLSMFLSCAWFFDDVSGIESLQALKHAGRALEFMKEYEASRFDLNSESTFDSRMDRQKINTQKIESTFLDILKQAKSNIPKKGNAKQLYQEHLPRWKMDLKKIASLCILDSDFLSDSHLFHSNNNSKRVRLYSSELEWKEVDYYEGLPRGVIKIRSQKTLEELECYFWVFLKKDLDDSNLYCWITDRRLLFDDSSEKTQSGKIQKETIQKALQKKYSGISSSSSSSSEFLESLLKSNETVYSLHDFGSHNNQKQERIVQLLFRQVLEQSKVLTNYPVIQALSSYEKTWKLTPYLPLAMLHLGLFLEELERIPFPLDDKTLEKVLQILEELVKPNNKKENPSKNSSLHSLLSSKKETELKKQIGFLLEKKLSIRLSIHSLSLVFQVIESCQKKLIPISFPELQKQYSDLSFQLKKEQKNPNTLFLKLGEKLGFSNQSEFNFFPC